MAAADDRRNECKAALPHDLEVISPLTAKNRSGMSTASRQTALAPWVIRWGAEASSDTLATERPAPDVQVRHPVLAWRKGDAQSGHWQEPGRPAQHLA
jgi:hypothetical protein